MRKIGCLGWGLIILIFAAISQAFSKNPWAVGTVIAIAIAASIAIYYLFNSLRNKENNAKLAANLTSIAKQLQSWANGSNLAEGTANTKEGEVALFDISEVDLLDFQSTGSTFTGGSAGISFPIVGRIRGNLGGSKGSLVRNPEKLICVDSGTLKITSKRILFIGNRETREIKLENLMDVELGPNGIWAKLSMNNKQKPESFQHLELDQLPLGIAIGIANAWTNEGESGARDYAKDMAEQIVQTIQKPQS
jgi:hypothetical protein